MLAGEDGSAEDAARVASRVGVALCGRVVGCVGAGASAAEAARRRPRDGVSSGDRRGTRTTVSVQTGRHGDLGLRTAVTARTTCAATQAAPPIRTGRGTDVPFRTSAARKSYTFTQPGTYTFVCDAHPATMTGHDHGHRRAGGADADADATTPTPRRHATPTARRRPPRRRRRRAGTARRRAAGSARARGHHRSGHLQAQARRPSRRGAKVRSRSRSRPR